MIINGTLDLSNCGELKDISKITEIKEDLILPGFDTDKNIKINPKLKVNNLIFYIAEYEKTNSYIFPKINSVQKLDLNNFTLLKKIPEGINYSNLKELNISWTIISELPDNMFNLEKLDCSYNKNISVIPKSSKKLKSININGTSIKELPELNTTLKDLEIGGSQIRKLPEKLKILNNCNISNLEISELPKEIKIGGNLYIDRNNFKTLPKNIEVNGYISIYGCPNLEYIPDTLKVIPYLGNNKSLKRIPKQILLNQEELNKMNYHSSYLDLKNCESIENLGTLKRIGLSIDLTNCFSLKTFSQLEYVNGWLHAENCKNLLYILKLKKVKGSLILKNCKLLKSLGTLNFVEKDLNLRGCDSLTLLPENLEIGGNIIISRNNKIKNLNKFKDKIQIYETYMNNLYKTNREQWKREVEL